MSSNQGKQPAGGGAADQPEDARPSNVQKDPRDWKTGDEPMTGAQASYLHTLAERKGEDVPDDLTKAEASQKIDELRSATGVAASEGGGDAVQRDSRGQEKSFHR